MCMKNSTERFRNGSLENQNEILEDLRKELSLNLCVLKEESPRDNNESEYYGEASKKSSIPCSPEKEYLSDVVRQCEFEGNSENWAAAQKPEDFLEDSSKSPERDATNDGERYDTEASRVEDLAPFTLDQIDERVEIRVVPGKGRCVFSKDNYVPGEIIFIEQPTLVATPSLDRRLWDILTEINNDRSLDLPPAWHLATLYSMTQLSPKDQKVILDKWVPDKNKEPSEDVERVLEKIELIIDPKGYERYLQAWRYNSFGHHIESDGLVLYNRISMIAHDCAASTSWHYGDNDSFVLRAKKLIRYGDEITISYIGDEDLYKPTNIRREKLSGWLFYCNCVRCADVIDLTRGFKCYLCGVGTVYFKTDRNPFEASNESYAITTATSCTVCQQSPSESVISQCMEYEDAYVARLEETKKTDLEDAELVYCDAQRLFSQHWVLYSLDGILFEGYRDSGRFSEAIVHQMNRIRYATDAFPHASFILAWLYEELGDTFKYQCLKENEGNFTHFYRNALIKYYENATNMLLMLCGYEHSYSLATHQKLESAFNSVVSSPPQCEVPEEGSDASAA